VFFFPKLKAYILAMDLKRLHQLVSRGEGQHVEFKRKSADPLKIVREVVAFANDKGGYLFIGVNDDGSIPGLKYPQEEAFILEKYIKEYCKPAVEYQLTYVPLNSKKQVLTFDIKKSKKKPVYLIYNVKKGSGRAYIRVEDKSVQASREVRKILKAQNSHESNGFNYGENEMFLVKYLSENIKVSLQEFAKAAAIKVEEASETLVQLTISNVLELHPADGEDWYTLKEIEG